jgi:KDO2-lipid IV(A) lauroyltransferase
MTLANRLITQTNANVLLGSALRTETGFDLYFSEVSEAIGDRDQAKALAALNQEIEKLIERSPCQYQWEYKRFRSPPAGVRKIY